MEYVHVTGPGDKGHVELAISKPKGAGCDTPTSEPGFSLTDQWDSDCDEMSSAEQLASVRFNKSHQRRLSDPSASIDSWIKGGMKSKPKTRLDPINLLLNILLSLLDICLRMKI